MAYEGLRPEITPLHQPFWDSVSRRELSLQRCDDCAEFRFIPTELCSACGSASATWTPIEGTGEVYTYTIVHRAPTPAYQADVPYVIAHVTLAEGPRMISNLIGCDPHDVRIGMPVRVVYEAVAPDLTLYKFTPETEHS
jgi:uncharacterized OB-fold protein